MADERRARSDDCGTGRTSGSAGVRSRRVVRAYGRGPGGRRSRGQRTFAPTWLTLSDAARAVSVPTYVVTTSLPAIVHADDGTAREKVFRPLLTVDAFGSSYSPGSR